MDSELVLQELNRQVIECRLCSRLDNYIKRIGQTKVKRHLNEEYWSNPLPSFGDPNAKLLIIGLAPAAHGGNRTGRMFTGDSSGDWLFKALYQTGFANQPTSKSRADGLVLRQAYITAAVRCAPPLNKPLPSELANCARYLSAELKLLHNVGVVVTLGRIAFDAYCRASGFGRLAFSHGARYEQSHNSDKKKILLVSFHPSRQNTNTGKLTWPMWIKIFRTARKLINSGSDN